jgi:hypothetical protein
MQGRDPRFGQQPYDPPPSPYGNQGYMPPPAPSPGHWGGHQLGGNLQHGLGAARQVSGLPAPLSFVLGLFAVALALAFDVIFLKVHIPGVGGYAWYLTTALSFAGAGWASIKWTRASRAVATTALALAAVLYGVADVGLGLVLEGIPMVTAIVLGAQGVGIALFTGFGGVFKAIRERE